MLVSLQPDSEPVRGSGATVSAVPVSASMEVSPDTGMDKLTGITPVGPRHRLLEATTAAPRCN